MESGGPYDMQKSVVSELPFGGTESVTNRISPGIRVSAVLLVLDGAWLAVWTSLKCSILAWFGGHVTLIAAVLWWAWRRRAQDADFSGPALAGMAVLLAGPLGAALALWVVRWLETRQPDERLLAAWYDRIALAGDIDPITHLSNTVSMGRAVQTTADMPRVFATVMADGSLEDRQTALGLIARRFSPSYAPALRAALVSSEPVIRVQAAAVAVKVRGDLKATLHHTLARRNDPGLSLINGLELAAEIQTIVEAEMLEDVDRAAAVAVVIDLIGSRVDALGGNPHDDDVAALSPEARNMLETALLDRGRFVAFRALRRIAQKAVIAPDAEIAHG
jgi:hypothetical protein